MKESICEEGDDDIDDGDIIQYNDFNTTNPNIFLIKVLRSHLQS